jgi:hypothetical protein
MTAVVYTAIFGNYDLLKQPASQDVDCEYLCFTDADMPPRAGAWRIIRVERDPGMHPRIQAKRFKILSHEIFPEGGLNTAYPPGLRNGRVDLSIWVDASISIKADTFVSDMRARLAGGEWAMFVHPDRDCIYEEAELSATLLKYKTLPVIAQVESYRSAVRPHSGLFACGIIVRREPSSRRLAKVQQLWWEENIRWTYQDQLSLPFALAAGESCHPVKIDAPLRNNLWFDIIPHARKE